MAENYKHLYEQMKKMVAMYQDELVPGFRKQIEELEAKSKWISVNDRLPELAGDYLGVKNYGGEDVLVDIVFYDLGWIDHNGEPETEPITHWMPLPEPPATCHMTKGE